MATERCAHSIEGPPMFGGRIVAWRKQCKRKAVAGESYCWQHLPMMALYVYQKGKDHD